MFSGAHCFFSLIGHFIYFLARKFIDTLRCVLLLLAELPNRLQKKECLRNEYDIFGYPASTLPILACFFIGKKQFMVTSTELLAFSCALSCTDLERHNICLKQPEESELTWEFKKALIPSFCYTVYAFGNLFWIRIYGVLVSLILLRHLSRRCSI